MPYRYDYLTPGEVYHVYTRGVEKRDIFLDELDRKRFLSLLIHCLPQGPIRSYSLSARSRNKARLPVEGTGLVDLYCYCLMTNHVHLLIRENVNGGTSLFMRRLLTSYACYFNIKRHRSGSLFLHPFKAVLVDGDEQLLHVSRYIHLNPYTAHLTDDIFKYPWSSLLNFIDPKPSQQICHTSLLTKMMGPDEYRSFVADHADYARSLAGIQHLLVD